MAATLCYGPTVFFRHLHVITLSYRHENFGVSLKNIIISDNLFLKLRKTEMALFKSTSVDDCPQ
jgi:hypothetical protein